MSLTCWRKNQLRVALWNGSGLDNLGDRLIDLVTRRELTRRLPNAECETFTPWPGLYCNKRLTIDRDGHWAGEDKFHAIVIGGGSLITGPPFAEPGSQYFLLGPYPEKFRDRCPIIWSSICSNTQFLAPLRESWRHFICGAADRMTLRTVRNERTKLFLQDCGVTSTIEVVPDVAILATSPNASYFESVDRPIVAVTVGRPTFPTTFLEYMNECAKADFENINSDLVQLTNRNEGEKFSDDVYADQVSEILRPLSRWFQLMIIGFGAMYGDHISAARVAARLPEARHVVLRDPSGTDAIQLFRSANCIVASRLHACVLAIATGTPFVAIDHYYEDLVATSKIAEFLQQAGFSHRRISSQEVRANNEALIVAVRAAIADNREPVVNAYKLLARRAKAHFDRLAAEI